MPPSLAAIWSTMSNRARTVLAPLLAAGLAMLLPSGEAGALIASEARLLAPHRAVYDVELATSESSSGIAALTGRLVFEFTGSTCEGFTQNMRFVMSITNRDGVSSISDMRSSTWEKADGGQFRFSVNNYENEQPSEQTSGNAVRGEGAGNVKVALEKPETSDLAIPASVLFPVQHTIALLAAARRGESLLTADLYDGSDKGAKVFLTTASIGRQRPTGNAAELEHVKNVEKLSGLPSWPVNIAFFEQGSDRAEGMPLHQMSFRFYENGVVRNLAIDYGTLMVKGKLAELEFYTPTPCE